MPQSFITVEQAIKAHDEIISETGGSHGVRDLGLLDSALNRPFHSFAGTDLYENIFEKTAALIHSLLLNHPFVDGNKRTSVYLGYRFLQINNYTLTATNNHLVRFALDIESKKLNLEDIANWLKTHSRKVK